MAKTIEIRLVLPDEHLERVQAMVDHLVHTRTGFSTSTVLVRDSSREEEQELFTDY